MDYLDYILFLPACIIAIVSIWFTVKTRCIQLRVLPHIWRAFFSSTEKGKGDTILPKEALCTAMSTTLGLGTMISPLIALRLGGPGVLFGYLLMAFFGSATTFLEVLLSLQHRKKGKDGTLYGGSMPYIEKIGSKWMARTYAFFCMVLMILWSGAHSNQFSQILASSQMGHFALSPLYSGLLLSVVTTLVVISGVKSVGKVSSKIVPLIFISYLVGCLWIIGSHVAELPHIFIMMYKSCFEPQSFGIGVSVGGLVTTLRWGVFKGVHATEAGIGTQTIPHSMAETSNPLAQASLSMVSTLVSGLVAFLGGLVALISHAWIEPQVPLGIDMVAFSFTLFFKGPGFALVVLGAGLFSVGTIIGNSFNASHCFIHIAKKRFLPLFFAVNSVAIVLSSLSDLTPFWIAADAIVALIALLNIYALMRAKVDVGFLCSQTTPCPVRDFSL